MLLRTIHFLAYLIALLAVVIGIAFGILGAA
jgi:hypothetical protein